MILFHEFVYQPVYNLLIFLYNTIAWQDFGIAIILVTIIIKFLLVPISRKQIESQKKMQELQPKIKALQEKHKNDKEKQSRALLEFYRENKINPFSGCLPVIFQIIFFIAIWRVLFNISQAGLVVNGDDLYSFVENPKQINHYFLNVLDLSKVVDFKNIDLSGVLHLVLVVLAALAQFLQSKWLMDRSKKEKTTTQKETVENDDFAQIMTKQMLYLAPVMTLFIGVKFQAGLALYWLISTIFAIIQQEYIQAKSEKKEISIKG